MIFSEQPARRPDGDCDAATSASDVHQWCALVERIKRNEPAAIEELYGKLRKFRYVFIRRLGPEHAEDATHSVFMKLMDQIQKGNLREPERLMAYAKTIAHREVCIGIKCIIATRDTHESGDAAFKVIDRGLSADDSMIKREQYMVMRECLQRLLPRDREILERFYLREQSPDQIQREMGLTYNQFRIFKSRAKSSIAQAGKRIYGARPPLRTAIARASKKARAA